MQLIIKQVTKSFSVLSNPPVTVRLIFTLATLLSVAIACLSDCIVLVSFSLNRSYIARNLCEKKDEPGNTCQGCCLLRKELQNEDRKEQSPPARSLKEFDDFQPVPATPPVVMCTPWTGEVFFASLGFAIPLPLGKDIDHPPENSFL
ncbi:MAG TPA: hypothetical protein VMM37_07340 [Bacteroidota bacterium]|nr:hypothetical protein [Bacteroidota bacterium]